LAFSRLWLNKRQKFFSRCQDFINVRYYGYPKQIMARLGGPFKRGLGFSSVSESQKASWPLIFFGFFVFGETFFGFSRPIGRL
jgi:hypothetical protein